jgi:hypothetical protein
MHDALCVTRMGKGSIAKPYQTEALGLRISSLRERNKMEIDYSAALFKGSRLHRAACTPTKKGLLCSLALASAPVFGMPYTWYSIDTAAVAGGDVQCVGDPNSCNPDYSLIGYRQQYDSSDNVTSAIGQSFSFGAQATALSYFSIGVPPSYPSTYFAQSAVGSVQGSVDFGVMHASVSSLAERTAYELCYGGCLQNRGFATAGASGETGWLDEVTITSDSLAAGTEVSVQVRFALHSLLASTETSAPCTPYTYPLISLSGSFGVSGGNFLFSHGLCTGNEMMAEVRTFLLEVGQTYNVSSFLLFITNAYVHPGTSDTEGSAIDASNTSLFTFKILTPGAGYVSASNTVYLTDLPLAQTVPEPSSHVLVLSALGLLGITATKLKKLAYLWTPPENQA